MKAHKFDVEDAKEYGIEKALLLEHIKFHQANNAGIEDYTIEGKTWCHAKRKTLNKMYPYLNARSISRWLKELEEDGIIQSCKPKSRRSDQTKYYHVVGYETANRANEPNGQNDHSKEQKTLSETNGANGQNDQSNGQNDRSMNGQNDHSSIVTNVYNCSEERAREGKDKTKNSDSPKSQEIKNRMYGAAIPDALRYPEFIDAYQRWRSYLKEVFRQHPNVYAVEQQFHQLHKFARQGHDPVKVINGCIARESKSLYIREDFGSEKKSDLLDTNPLRHAANRN